VYDENGNGNEARVTINYDIETWDTGGGGCPIDRLIDCLIDDREREREERNNR
jgi:hypothetical protein